MPVGFGPPRRTETKWLVFFLVAGKRPHTYWEKQKNEWYDGILQQVMPLQVSLDFYRISVQDLLKDLLTGSARTISEQVAWQELLARFVRRILERARARPLERIFHTKDQREMSMRGFSQNLRRIFGKICVYTSIYKFSAHAV